MKFLCPVLGQYPKFPSQISKTSSMMLSIESYGSKRASTECETEVSFRTQVAYFFRKVGMKSIFGLLPRRQGKAWRWRFTILNDKQDYLQFFTDALLLTLSNEGRVLKIPLRVTWNIVHCGSHFDGHFIVTSRWRYRWQNPNSLYNSFVLHVLLISMLSIYVLSLDLCSVGEVLNFVHITSIHLILSHFIVTYRLTLKLSPVLQSWFTRVPHFSCPQSLYIWLLNIFWIELKNQYSI